MFRVQGSGFRVQGLDITPIMENVMERKMENGMETGVISGSRGISTNILVLGSLYNYSMGYIHSNRPQNDIGNYLTP